MEAPGSAHWEPGKRERERVASERGKREREMEAPGSRKESRKENTSRKEILVRPEGEREKRERERWRRQGPSVGVFGWRNRCG